MYDVPLAPAHRHPVDLGQQPLRRVLPLAGHPDGSLSARIRVNGWRSALAAGGLVASLIAGPSVKADEFNPLVVYDEARVLNDQWQVCAASFIRGRLQTHQTAERLAEQALDQCRAKQGSLNRFLIKRVGGRSASNVMALLREKYQSGLIAAIAELRTRD
jgi:hypothetical protein